MDEVLVILAIMSGVTLFTLWILSRQFIQIVSFSDGTYRIRRGIKGLYSYFNFYTDDWTTDRSYYGRCGVDLEKCKTKYSIIKETGKPVK